MALFRDDQPPYDDQRFPSSVHKTWGDHLIQFHPSLLEQVKSGQIQRPMIIGTGIAGLTLAQMLCTAARNASREITVILVSDQGACPSDGSGGWFMQFVCPDPRAPEWALRSFPEWDQLFADAELSPYRERMPSIIVSRHSTAPIPAGYPGRAHHIDPADWSLPSYRSAVLFDDGAVISACALMPHWRQQLAKDPSVIAVTNHLARASQVVQIAEEYRADIVCVAAGDRARFLLDDDRVDDDFGVLLRGPLGNLPGLFQSVVVMDEDADHELAYSIPHRACGHVLFGGKSGDLITQEWEYRQIQAANTNLAAAPRFARDAVHEVHERILDRMPALARALPADPTLPGNYWFGLRPRASRVIAEWHPTTGAPLLVIGGLGGSGFTITPAVILDALNAPIPRHYRTESAAAATDETTETGFA